MSMTDELERLAGLRKRGMLTGEEFEQAKRNLLAAPRPVGVRRQSKTMIAGLPLWAIATGPDPNTGQMRGHAKAIIAIGDTATGVVALGGFARGLIAFGGLAAGVISAGGLAIGLALAAGGAAIGGVAIGGGAAGGVAIGGGAIGRYAMGGAAAGGHVISAERCDAEAAEFFTRNSAWALLAGDSPGLHAHNRSRLCAPRAN